MRQVGAELRPGVDLEHQFGELQVREASADCARRSLSSGVGGIGCDGVEDHVSVLQAHAVAGVDRALQPL